MEFKNLVKTLAKTKRETEWLEFKHNNITPQEIGEYISALSNASAILEKPCAYIVWGISNNSYEIIGTKFKPKKVKIGNEELENWLLTQLEPRIGIDIIEEEIENKPVVIFKIQPASNRPVRFKGIEYIRIGSYKKRLHDHPEKERELWRMFDNIAFEKRNAKNEISSDEVLSLIDYPGYFQLIKQPLPDNRDAILHRLMSENIITRAGSKYNITNLGAILFAKNLDDFEYLSRKALRIIMYDGPGKMKAIKEKVKTKGYAVGLEEMIEYITDILPQSEEIQGAFRKEIKMYPEVAIRELVANALIHQNLNVTGMGPMVEIFDGRIEISNPGIPLIDTLRFIDEPPKSRNEVIAKMMRRTNICEDRGSGIDKAISEIELFQLPPLDFRVTQHSTIAFLYGPKKFSQIDQIERRRACYQHTCLQHIYGRQMTNASLRKRLGIKSSSYSLAYRIIKDSINAELIKPHKGEKSSGQGSSYVPFWA